MSDLPRLTYVRPRSLSEAFTALERTGSAVYAGGTDLIVALQKRSSWVRALEVLVDIKGLDEAQRVEDHGEEFRIGALVTAEELAQNPLIAAEAPAVAEAAAMTSAPMLRARGTVGGNLVTPHPAGDIATAMLALGARVEVATSATSIDTVGITAVLSGERGSLGQRDLLLGIRIPKCRDCVFEKKGSRGTFSRATAAVALARLQGRASVALGGLVGRPFLASETASAIDRGEDIGAALKGDCSDRGTSLDSSQVSLLVALVERAQLRLGART